MAPVCTSIHAVESSHEWLLSGYVMSPGQIGAASTSVGCSPRPAGGLPRILSNYCFCLGPSTCEILCVPFRSEVSIFSSPVGLSKLSSTSLQSQIFWGLIFPVQDTQAGEPNMRFRGLNPVGKGLNIIIFLFLGCPPGLCDLTMSQVFCSLSL